MNGHERLRTQIDSDIGALRGEITSGHEEAVVALLRAYQQSAAAPSPLSALVFGTPVAHPGLNLALRLVLESNAPRDLDRPPDDWATAFLAACDGIAGAETILAHTETGFMKLVEEDGGYSAWIAGNRRPVRWRERSGYLAWADHELEVEKSFHQDTVTAFSHQFGYPRGATLCGFKTEEWFDVWSSLMNQIELVSDGIVATSESDLVDRIARRTRSRPETVARRLAGYTLTAQNAAWHTAVAGAASPPVIRVSADRIVIWRYAFSDSPFLFLTRELRRQDPDSYHNASRYREDHFRRQLYEEFSDRRFLTARNRIVLRRPDGDARTDIDAAIFDRKSGALALFELKSQDPFARSTAELHRQRDSVLEANRQIGGILDWLNRRGPDDILNRIDAATAKRFKVQKVLPFVLGRCVIRFDDGPATDRRSAWVTWPQLLDHLAGVDVANSANPLASLFTRFQNDEIPPVDFPADQPSYPIPLGETGRRLTLYPSYSAYQQRR